AIVASHWRWASKPSRVSMWGSGSAGTLASSHCRTSSRNSRVDASRSRSTASVLLLAGRGGAARRAGVGAVAHRARVHAAQGGGERVGVVRFGVGGVREHVPAERRVQGGLQPHLVLVRVDDLLG